jgi:hypothetical protein
LQRLEVKRETYRSKWWQFAEKGVELYKAISKNSRVLVLSQNTKPVAFSMVNKIQVFDSKLVVFSHEDYARFSILQSTFHNNWAWKFGTTLGSGTLTYTPTVVYQSFPFPCKVKRESEESLDTIGEHYHEHRHQIMLKLQLGLTKTYNAFHAPEINNSLTWQLIYRV